jgi:N-hydroxyarylamine O-acetyltransferase
MDLSAYLARIGFTGAPQPDAATLIALHRAHLRAIAYENLDVQQGVPATIDTAAAFDKLVTRGRGGWCYEMNGVLGAALAAIGFKVTRLAGAVMRETGGDAMIGNHLVLIVDLDRPWLADVGFGDGMFDPVPLQAGAFSQGTFDFRLEDLGDGWWRLHNHPEGGARSFDFNRAVRDQALLENRCAFLQQDPSSLMLQNAIVQRHGDNAMAMLVNRTLKRVSAAGVTKEVIPDAAAYVRTLRDVFALDVPDAAGLWPRLVARHEAMVQAQQQQQ